MLRRLKIHSLTILILLLLAGPATVWAQYYDSPGLGNQPVAQHPQDYKPLGLRAGAFMLHPGVQLAAEYTDNVFYANKDLNSDVVYHIRPYISAQSTWSRHSFNFTAGADFTRYSDFSERDYEDYFFGISGRIDVKNRSYFSYSLDYMDLHEDLNNRNSEQGIEPTRYDMTGANLEYDHTFNRLSVGGSIGYSDFDYDNALDSDGDVIDNEDRDRKDGFYTLRAGYQFRTDMQAFVAYQGYNVDYDQQFDRNGYDRTGDGYAIDGGVSFTVTGKLEGDVSVGYYSRSYNDERLLETDGWGFGAGLTWFPSYLTSFRGQVETNIQETTDPNSSGFLQTVYSLRVDHELLRQLQVNTFVQYRDYDYQNIVDAPVDARSSDGTWRAGLGASWFINRHVYLNASYSWEELDSSIVDDDYTVNRVWLVLGLEY